MKGAMTINVTEKEKLRIKMSKEIWLSFFNEYLFRCGLITQDERLKMSVKIVAYIGRTRR